MTSSKSVFDADQVKVMSDKFKFLNSIFLQGLYNSFPTKVGFLFFVSRIQNLENPNSSFVELIAIPFVSYLRFALKLDL